MRYLKKVGVVVVLISVTFISVSYKSNFFEIAKQIEIFTTLFKELNMYYIDETNPAELTDVAIQHMLEDLDPYTRFYDEQGVENAKINATGQYGGIGAISGFIDDKLVIIEPHEGAPADESGLKAGDEIISVNNVLVKEYDKNAVSTLLQGVPGSKVNLKIKRQNKIMDVELEREKIEVNPVPYYDMIDNEVGYISFIKFNQKASSEVRNAFEDLKAQGMKKLILDVRGNPGGLVNEAIEIVNFFIPRDETVVTTKAKVKKWSDVYKTKKEPIDLTIPITVLIDRKSASASEILAGSLQDFDRAVIIGERSFGKGLVQRYRKLTYGTQLKLTISKYYTPSGRSIQELDYTNRDENGNVPKFSENKRNAFKTRNGRTVYDGGGIQPDIEFNKPKETEATKALLNSSAIFNFATQYYHSNPSVNEARAFAITDADYDKFITHLKEEDTSFKTKTELSFEKALKQAEKEDYSNSIRNIYKDLQTKLRIERINDLSLNKEEIKEELTSEIVKRYYYKKGEYINKVHNDKYITQALDLLKNDKKYANILK